MHERLQPLAAQDRLQSLDVLRGVALLGIALMNVEFFSRPLAALGDGLPPDLAGADAWAALGIHLFVRNKFFTLFSMLFGMGFALMLLRAQAAGRPFLGPYLRRTLGLALFGLLHGCLLWAGDILLSYASAAVLLLVALFGRSWMLWLAIALVIALGVVVDTTGDSGFTALILVIDGLILSWLRRGAGSGQALQGRALLRAGYALYLVPALLMAFAGGAMWASEAASAARTAPLSAEQAKQRAEHDQLLAKYRAAQEQKKLQETRAMTRGSYGEALAFRAPSFLADYVKSLFFISIAMGLFMIGAWLLQSGVMQQPEQHRALFRHHVGIALPLGLLVSVVSVLVATDAGAGQGRWLLATGLLFAGGLPMSLGYLGLLMLALQQEGGRRWLGWLAPAGRMALTNYIGQSLLCGLFFYGYGLGQWGLPRAQQVLFVLAMFAVQVVCSRWWLARFRFGPLEWLWRWLTYGQRPAWRVAR